ncbi:uncharacterized protein [Physeter macrocephalus]|uniref:Uncharacterized protein n=1 Tax=Physeter macrocephalus TaxID=9755 RepID=A0A9W2X105_PHYMC|nr:uncharacterized protein LOC102983463 [Physeter catodon]
MTMTNGLTGRNANHLQMWHSKQDVEPMCVLGLSPTGRPCSTSVHEAACCACQFAIQELPGVSYSVAVTILHSYKQGMSVPVAPHPRQHLMMSVPWVLAILVGLDTGLHTLFEK